MRCAPAVDDNPPFEPLTCTDPMKRLLPALIAAAFALGALTVPVEAQAARHGKTHAVHASPVAKKAVKKAGKKAGKKSKKAHKRTHAKPAAR